MNEINSILRNDKLVLLRNIRKKRDHAAWHWNSVRVNNHNKRRRQRVFQNTLKSDSQYWMLTASTFWSRRTTNVAKHVQIKLKMKQTLQVNQSRPVPRCTCIPGDEYATLRCAAPPEFRFVTFVSIQCAWTTDEHFNFTWKSRQRWTNFSLKTTSASYETIFIKAWNLHSSSNAENEGVTKGGKFEIVENTMRIRERNSLNIFFKRSLL